MLALLDRKLGQLDDIMREMNEFRQELMHLRVESQVRLEQLPDDGRICGIVEQGIHGKGQVALTWLEGSRKRS